MTSIPAKIEGASMPFDPGTLMIPYPEIIARLKPGDGVGVRGTAWISGEIRKADLRMGGMGRISHIAVITATGVNPQATEALSQGVVTRSFWQTIQNAEHVYIYSPDFLNDEQRQNVVNRALSFSADSYGWLDIGAMYGDSLTKSHWFTTHLGPHIGLQHHPICSLVWAESMASNNYFFGEPEDSVTPGNIDMWCVGHQTDPHLQKVGFSIWQPK